MRYWASLPSSVSESFLLLITSHLIFLFIELGDAQFSAAEPLRSPQSINRNVKFDPMMTRNDSLTDDGSDAQLLIDGYLQNNV